MEFEMQEARVAALLSIDEFNRLPGTPLWVTGAELSKSHIIVWFRYSQRIQAIPNDIQSRRMMRNRRGS